MLWGRLVAVARDLVRLSAFLPTAAQHKHFIKLTQAFAVLLNSKLRSGRTRADAADPSAFRDDAAPAITELLGEEETENFLSRDNPVLYTQFRMTAVLKDALADDKLYKGAFDSISAEIRELGYVAGGCERLVSTPIPLSYSRHCSRSLIVFCLSLPLALWGAMGWTMVPTIFVMTYLFLGVDEIGVEIEEPFCILPLKPLVAAVYKAADEANACGELCNLPEDEFVPHPDNCGIVQ